jgi:hypothetical protein
MGEIHTSGSLRATDTTRATIPEQVAVTANVAPVVTGGKPAPYGPPGICSVRRSPVLVVLPPKAAIGVRCSTACLLLWQPVFEVNLRLI